MNSIQCCADGKESNPDEDAVVPALLSKISQRSP